MEKLPADILIQTILNLTLSDLNNLCLTSSYFNNKLCNNKVFWVNKLHNNFDLIYSQLETEKSPKKYYQYLYQLEPNKGLELFASEGNIKGVKFMVKMGATFWNAGMKNAAIGGHLDIIEYFVERVLLIGIGEWKVHQEEDI